MYLVVSKLSASCVMGMSSLSDSDVSVRSTLDKFNYSIGWEYRLLIFSFTFLYASAFDMDKDSLSLTAAGFALDAFYSFAAVFFVSIFSFLTG